MAVDGPCGSSRGARNHPSPTAAPTPTPPLAHAPPAPAPAPQEAKQFLHEKDGAPQKAAAAARDPRANAKPKVDLFS